MSLYVFNLYPKRAIVSADTRMCISHNNELYKLHDEAQKLFVINDLIITTGGAGWVCSYIMHEYFSSPSHSIKRLYEIALDTIARIDEVAMKFGASAQNSDYKSNPYLLELCILQYNQTLQNNVFYHISTSNAYQLEQHIIREETRIYGGVDMKIVQQYLHDNASAADSNYIGTLTSAYEAVTSEAVGGSLMIACQDRMDLQIFELPLKDGRAVKIWSDSKG